MKNKDLSSLSNEELLVQAKKVQFSPVVNALLVGVMGGVIVYSIFAGSLSFFTLIPVFFIYLLVRNGEQIKKMKAEIQARNLKEVSEKGT